ncbi:MAG: hypothetical protein JXA57_04405 [Armatimonadetes bacterium]|nr:hypothetical protein [Armatimonadota bacterium]
MSDAVVRAGWWFATGLSLIVSAREYQQKYLSRAPTMKAPRSRLARDRQERAARPAPPRKGAVITHMRKRIYPTAESLPDQAEPRTEEEDQLYEVAPRARKALDLLERLARASGGGSTNALERLADAYSWITQPDVVCLADVFRLHGLLFEAQEEFDRVTSSLEDARETGAKPSIIAGHEAKRAQLRTRLAALNRKVKMSPAGDDELGLFCMAAAETKGVQEIASTFVEEYGPLILDFGTWCNETGYGYRARRDPALEGHYTTPLRFLANERYMWPKRWRRWAIDASLDALARGEPPAAVAPPVGFYVWAAYMLTALREHPEWAGCRIFLANRLASLRLVSDGDWNPALVNHYPSREGRRLAARLHGELLDYLALGAVYHGGQRSIDKIVPCARCLTPFPSDDGRRRYCDSCSKPKYRRAVRAQRYRERRKGRTA